MIGPLKTKTSYQYSLTLRKFDSYTGYYIDEENFFRELDPCNQKLQNIINQYKPLDITITRYQKSKNLKRPALQSKIDKSGVGFEKYFLTEILNQPKSVESFYKFALDHSVSKQRIFIFFEKQITWKNTRDK